MTTTYTDAQTLAIAVQARNKFETDRQQNGLPPYEDGAMRAALDAVAERKAASQAQGGEAAALFGGRRMTPEGTREFWGHMLEGVNDPPFGTPMYFAANHPVATHEAWRELKPTIQGATS